MKLPAGKWIFCSLIAVLLGATGSGQALDPVERGRGLPNFLHKLATEKKARVVFLGGSITQNDHGYTKMISEWLEKKWPDVKFTFLNAGLSSTGSVTGAFRFPDQVLAKGPVDLLIVEFAVNDDQDSMLDSKTATRGLEGIVRQFWKANPTGDILSVDFVNPPMLEKIRKGTEAVSTLAHKRVARHYHIPIVDVGRALANEIAAGRKTWDKDYGGTHPNSAGYAFATGLITQVIEKSEAGREIQKITMPEPLDAASYDRARFVDPQTFNWLGGWKFEPVSKRLLPTGAIRSDYEKYKALRSDGPGDMLYHTFLGRTLGAFVLAGPDAGMFDVSIDGGKWKQVDTWHHFSKNLNYPRSVILADDLSPGYHQVALRVSGKKNPESKGHAVTVLFFEVNE